MKEIQQWVDSNPINASKVAAYLGISRASFNNKMKGLARNKFTPEELSKLQELVRKVKDNSEELEKILKSKT